MAGIYKKAIEDWVKNSLNSLDNKEVLQDIHIDNLITQSIEELRKEDILNVCIDLLNFVIKVLKNISPNLELPDIWMNIDLHDDNEAFIGKPDSIENLITMIDQQSVPELIFYRKQNTLNNSFNEFYRVLLDYDYFKGYKNIKVLYKEYKSSENNAEDYIRELNLFYSPPPPHQVSTLYSKRI